MTKEEFIGNYLQKSRRLKKCNLPYGMQYLSLVSQVEEDAEKKYKSYIKKQKNNKTMKAQELRIGNYLKRLDESVFEVNSEDIQIVDRWDSSEDLLPKPIPLTEEWLLKFWFEKKKYSGHNAFHILNTWVIRDIYINQYDWGFQTDFLRDCDIELKYVHQLQNLYFILIGEELTAKEELT